MPARPPVPRPLYEEFSAVVDKLADLAREEGKEGREALATAIAWSRKILSDLEIRFGLTTATTVAKAVTTPVTTLVTTPPSPPTTPPTTAVKEVATTSKKSVTTASPALIARIREMKESGMTQRAMVGKLNEEKVPTPGGNTRWHLIQLQRVLAAM